MPPLHIVACAVVVLNDKGELLLVKTPRRGWECPGGQVEAGESLRDAAIREVREESGVEIEILKFCGVFQNLSKGICANLFLGRPVGGSPRPSDETVDAGWFPLATALPVVTWSNYRMRIEFCLDSAKHPFLVEF